MPSLGRTPPSRTRLSQPRRHRRCLPRPPPPLSSPRSFPVSTSSLASILHIPTHVDGILPSPSPRHRCHKSSARLEIPLVDAPSNSLRPSVPTLLLRLHLLLLRAAAPPCPFNLSHYISHSTSPWLTLINLLCSCCVPFLHMLPAERGGNFTHPSLLLCATCIMWETPKFAQIFRPRMVASKIRRHRLGAGFGEDAAVHDENNDAVISYSTWNVGGVAPPDDLDLQD